jgi:hypothetical protein
MRERGRDYQLAAKRRRDSNSSRMSSSGRSPSGLPEIAAMRRAEFAPTWGDLFLHGSLSAWNSQLEDGQRTCRGRRLHEVFSEGRVRFTERYQSRVDRMQDYEGSSLFSAVWRWGSLTPLHSRRPALQSAFRYRLTVLGESPAFDAIILGPQRPPLCS